MNAKAIFGLVIGVALLITALIWSRPAPQVGPAPQDAARADSAVDGQGVRSGPRAELDTARVGEVVAELFERIEALERYVERLDPARELDDLESRVTRLERSMRDSRTGELASRSQSSEIAELRRQNESLKRAHGQLASKVANAENKTSPAINDLRVLQQKVFSLENSVRLLESRR